MKLDKLHWIMVGALIIGLTSIGAVAGIGLSERDKALETISQQEAVIAEIEGELAVAQDSNAQLGDILDQCSLKSELYKYSVEGLANSVLSVMNGAKTMPDITKYAEAKQQADAIPC